MDYRPVLEGVRARLVPLEREHVDALWAAGRAPEIWAYMPVRMETREDMEAAISAALTAREQGKEIPFAIVDRETEQVVGSTRFLDVDPANRAAEIGWTWLSPAVWRTRINTECKRLLLGHAFETMALIRVQLKTDARNARSQAAIERIGGVKEGVLRHHRILPDGYLRDSVYYSILAEEWPAVKAKLEALLGGG